MGESPANWLMKKKGTFVSTTYFRGYFHHWLLLGRLREPGNAELAWLTCSTDRLLFLLLAAGPLGPYYHAGQPKQAPPKAHSTCVEKKRGQEKAGRRAARRARRGKWRTAAESGQEVGHAGKVVPRGSRGSPRRAGRKSAVPGRPLRKGGQRADRKSAVPGRPFWPWRKTSTAFSGASIFVDSKYSVTPLKV